MKSIQKIALCLWPLFIGSVVLLACLGPEPTPPPVGAFKVKMSYKNFGGADLLNPQTPNSFKKENLKVIIKHQMGGVI